MIQQECCPASALAETILAQVTSIKNRSTHDRDVILEQPIRTDWKLADAKQAYEKTRDLYRFQVAVPAGKVVGYEVVEERPWIEEHGGRLVYDVANGISVKIESNVEFSRLIDLKIVKGVVQPTFRTRETRLCPSSIINSEKASGFCQERHRLSR